MYRIVMLCGKNAIWDLNSKYVGRISKYLPLNSSKCISWSDGWIIKIELECLLFSHKMIGR